MWSQVLRRVGRWKHRTHLGGGRTSCDPRAGPGQGEAPSRWPLKSLSSCPRSSGLGASLIPPIARVIRTEQGRGPRDWLGSSSSRDCPVCFPGGCAHSAAHRPRQGRQQLAECLLPSGHRSRLPLTGRCWSHACLWPRVRPAAAAA